MHVRSLKASELLTLQAKADRFCFRRDTSKMATAFNHSIRLRFLSNIRYWYLWATIVLVFIKAANLLLLTAKWK